MDYHAPVMLRECIEGLQCGSGGTYVDVTFGGGGHAKAILEAFPDGKGKLYAFDQDQDAKANAKDISHPGFTLVEGNFKHLTRYLRFYKIDKIDGLLADLGVSSHQFDIEDRGFSFRFPEAILDMRMDQSTELSAATILNDYDDDALRKVLYTYGELKNGGKVAQAILRQRNIKAFETVGDLLSVIDPLCPIQKRNKFRAQVFQALRMEVNGELESLEALLLQSESLMKSGGRMVVMSYHSLEDRMVKNFFKKGKIYGEEDKDIYGNVSKPYREITRRPIVPTEEEIARNPRARSAKLRIAEKI
jgi:16S rRNA (cytosine1402-N4)-methyltransferase